MAAVDAPVYPNRVVAFGIARNVSADEAKELFAKYGSLVKFRLQAGVARMTYETEEQATAALAMHDYQMGERKLRVEKELKKSRGERKSAAAAEAGEGKPARAPRAPPAADPRQIRIDGLAEGTTADNLKAFVASSGRVTNVRLIKNGTAALVSFDEESEANKAVGLSGSVLNGAALTVAKDAGAPRTEKAPKARKEKAAASPSAAAPSPVADGKTVWVGGIPEGSTEESITATFSTFGAVTKVALKGKYAYVSFEEAEAATKAAEGDNGEMKVELARGAAKKGGRKNRNRRNRKPKAAAAAAEATA